MAEGEGVRQPWDQMSGEPDMWYARFKVYLELGPARTVPAGARVAGEKARGEPYYHNLNWYNNAKFWYWRQRAQAWDVHQYELLALSERNARLALRSRRIDRMEDYLEAISAVLDAANLTEVDQAQARAWLPQMRVFLRDLLVAQRQEFERDLAAEVHGGGTEGEGLTITADDLRAAQRLLESEVQAVRAGMPATVLGGSGLPGAGGQAAGPVAAARLGPATDLAGEKIDLRRVKEYPLGRTLYVCVGSGEGLMLDLAALRAVRAATGLKFHRTLDATRPKFDKLLRRERSLSRPVELLHLALHAAPAGVEFADGIADGNWLSERLDGVRILLLASCECDTVGDWLGVVPHVITFGEEISHEDAAALAQGFWRGIGLRKEPGEALDEALVLCPPAVGEYVVRHW